jgi:hypothetical protein
MSNIGDLGIMELEAFTVFVNPTPTHAQPFSMLCVLSYSSDKSAIWELYGMGFFCR